MDVSPDARDVFVVHGRNLAARDAVFEFLRAVGLRPMEWSEAVHLTGAGAPYIGEVLDHAFDAAQAVVVLLTPDDIAYLRGEFTSGDDDADTQPKAQARPNVLFEAGMAFGRHPRRTILVEFGAVRPFSDVAGRHAIRLDNSAPARRAFAERLATAGAAVELGGVDWLTIGDLTPPPPPGGGLSLGRKLSANSSGSGVRFDARYVNQGSGNGRLQVTNLSAFPVHDLAVELPPESQPGFWIHAEPIKKLPSGKTATFIASRSMGGGAQHFEITVKGTTPDGIAVSEDVFISLPG